MERRIIKQENPEDKIKISLDTDVNTLKGNELIEWVDKQLEYRQSFYLSAAYEPTYNELLKLQLQWISVFDNLNRMYVSTENNVKEAKTELEIWLSEKSDKVRNEFNDPSKPASKWLSAGEVNSIVISRWTDAYKTHQANIRFFEEQLKFLSNQLLSWQSYQFIISNISKLQQEEMKAAQKDAEMPD
jgi:hypothetical protein